MPRGGARVNSGPPPDPNALRRDRKDDKAGWISLPSEGRQKPAPEWPLPPVTVFGDSDEAETRRMELGERELQLWAEMWAKPQAVMWERLRCADRVALYVRLQVLGERTGEKQKLSEARMIGDRLGLDPASMLRLRWKVVTDELAERRSRPVPAPRSNSVRDRLRSVNGGA
ncbi:hypothetical protein GCM10027059_25940 [Myceligenerans halotolerans]